MLESFIGFSIFIGVLVFIYFKVVKPQMDKKKEVDPVVPPVSVLKEEEGMYLGAGNPMGNGPRPLWKFSKEGAGYGNGVEVWISGKLAFTVATGGKRQDMPDGCLWKPVSDVLPKGCAVHGPGGSTATKCIIKFKG